MSLLYNVSALFGVLILVTMKITYASHLIQISEQKYQLYSQNQTDKKVYFQRAQELEYNQCEKEVRQYLQDTLIHQNYTQICVVVLTKPKANSSLSVHLKKDQQTKENQNRKLKMKQFINFSKFRDEINILKDVKERIKCRYFIKDYEIDQTNKTTINIFIQPELFSLLEEMRLQGEQFINQISQIYQHNQMFIDSLLLENEEENLNRNTSKIQSDLLLLQKYKIPLSTVLLKENLGEFWEIKNSRAHMNRYFTNQKRILAPNQVPDSSGKCGNGYFKQGAFCFECPLPALTCQNRNKMDLCKADNADPKNKCFCNSGQHLYYNQSLKKYSCINATELIKNNIPFCRNYEGLIEFQDSGSICNPCLDIRCKRCTFSFNTNLDFSSIKNGSMALYLTLQYEEQCEQCERTFLQTNKAQKMLCSDASANCTSTSSCLKCNQQFKCEKCNLNFTLYEKEKSRCHTLPNFLSYPSPTGMGIDIPTPDIVCKADEVAEVDMVKGEYKCSPKCQIQNCNKCNIATGECTICNEGYFIYNSKECLECNLKNCDKVSISKESTISCINYLSFEKGCALKNQCNPNEIKDPITNNCLQCPSFCSSCEYDAIKFQAKCKECNDTYDLIDNQCVPQCSLQQYRDSISKKCLQCEFQCLQCSSNITCTQCDKSKGYYNLSSIAIDKNKRLADYTKLYKTLLITYAKTKSLSLYLNENTCFKTCADNSYLYQPPSTNPLDNTEIGLAKTMTSLLKAPCLKINNCSFADTFSNYCIECSTGYFKQGNQCILIPQCESNQYLDLIKYQCSPCPSLCNTCFYEQSTQLIKCTKCSDGCEINLESNQCLIKNIENQFPTKLKCNMSGCNSCVMSRETELCQSCDQGYLLYNNDCLKKEDLTQNCPKGQYSQFNQKLNQVECKQCEEFCVDCSNTDIFNNSQKPTCNECQKGYSISPSKLMCMQDSNSGKQCESNQSLQTYQAIFFCENCAAECEGGCYDFQPKINCKNCIDGYKLDNNICVKICPQGYYFQQQKRICQQCITSNCLECDISGICIKCQPYFTLINNSTLSEKTCELIQQTNNNDLPVREQQIKTIISCPYESFYIFQFDTCYCNLKNYTFNKDRCQKDNSDNTVQCVSGQFLDPSSKTCKLCPYDKVNQTSSCLKCSDSYNCLVCDQGYYLNKNSQCTKCPGNCAICFNSDNCVSCNLGYLLQFDSVTNVGKCVYSCSDGYLASLDSSFLWNTAGTFREQSYEEFIINIKSQASTASIYLPEPVALINQSEQINYIPNGFEIQGGKLIAFYNSKEIKMSCIMCQKQCTKCPDGYYLNSQTAECTKECQQSRIVNYQSRQCTSYRNFNPNYTIKCLSCDTNGKQYYNNMLTLFVDSEDIFYSANWKVVDVTGINYNLDEKTKFQIIEDANQSQIRSKVVFAIDSKFLGKEVEYTIQFGYTINNNGMKTTKIVVQVLTFQGNCNYRQMYQLGVKSEMFNFYNNLQQATNLDQPFSILDFQFISYFIPQPYFSLKNYELKVIFTFERMKYMYFTENLLSNNFAGTINLFQQALFVPNSDYMKVIFCVIYKDTYLQSSQNSSQLSGEISAITPKIKFLKSFSIQLNMKPLDIEYILTNYKAPQDTDELVYLFKVSISLYRQMLFAELNGKLASINLRINDIEAEKEQKDQLNDTIFTIGDYYKMIKSKNHDFRTYEKNYFSTLISTPSEQGSLVYLKECSDKSTYGYFCKITQAQQTYFQNSINYLLDIFIILSNNSDIFNSSLLEYFLRSIQYLTRFAQNNAALYSKFQSILEKCLSKITNANLKPIVAELVVDIHEMALRNKIENNSFQSTFQFMQQNLDQISYLSLKTLVTNILIKQFQQSELALEIDIGLDKKDTTKLHFPSQSSQYLGKTCKILVINQPSSIISSQFKNLPGVPVSNHISLSYTEGTYDEYIISFKLSGQTQKRNLQEKKYQFACYNTQENTIDKTCSLQIVSSSQLDCKCKNQINSMVILELEITSNNPSVIQDITDHFSIIDEILSLNCKFIQSIIIVASIYLILPVIIIFKRQRSMKISDSHYVLPQKHMDYLTSHKKNNQQADIKQFPQPFGYQGGPIQLNILNQNKNNLININYTQTNEILQPNNRDNLTQFNQNAQKQLRPTNIFILNKNNTNSNDKQGISEDDIQFEYENNFDSPKSNQKPIQIDHQKVQREIDSIKQIKEYKSIIINKIPSSMVNLKDAPIENPFTCLSFIRAVAYGVKRPYSLFYSKEGSLTIIADAIIQILQSCLGILIVEVVSLIPIQCIIMVLIHQVSVVFQNYLRSFICKAFLLAAYLIVLVIGYVSYFFYLIYINPKTENQFEEWSEASFKIIVIEALLLQTLNALYTVQLFRSQIRWKLLYDFQSCVYYFRYYNFAYPSFFKSQTQSSQEKSNQQKEKKNDSPITSFNNNLQNPYKIQIEGKNKSYAEIQQQFSIIQQDQNNNNQQQNFKQPSSDGIGTQQVLQDLLGEVDFVIQNYQIKQINPSSTSMLSESINQDLKLPQHNEYKIQSKKIEIKKKFRKIDSLPPKITDLNIQKQEIRNMSETNSFRKCGRFQNKSNQISIDMKTIQSYRNSSLKPNTPSNLDIDILTPDLFNLEKMHKKTYNNPLTQKVLISSEIGNISSQLPYSNNIFNEIPLEKSQSYVPSVRNFNQILHQQK